MEALVVGRHQGGTQNPSTSQQSTPIDHTRAWVLSILPPIETIVATTTHSSPQGRCRSQTSHNPKRNLLERARQRRIIILLVLCLSFSKGKKRSKQAASRLVTFRNKVRAFATEGTRVATRHASPPAVGVETPAPQTQPTSGVFVWGKHTPPPPPPPLPLKKKWHVSVGQ